MKIDREGHKIILTAFLICGLIATIAFLFVHIVAASILAVALFLFWLFIVRFFRVPYIPLLQEDGAVYSPAYGTVVVIEKAYEGECFDEELMQISIFMSIWDVHANWFPVAGCVEYFRHHHGKYMVAWHPKSSTDNERTTTIVRSANGVRVLFRQIAGILAKRIVSYAIEGTTVGQNSRCGFIKFGSRLDVFIPLDSVVNVKIGDKVKGAQTIIAHVKK